MSLRPDGKRPEVTRLVLFKHGMAYLERQGPSDGEFDLVFRRSEMNDALKSLAVGVGSGGATVRSIGYEAPTDPEDDLDRRNLLWEPDEALLGLLTAARGRAVEVTDIDGVVVRGEVLGVQAREAGKQGTRRILTLRTADRAISLVDVERLAGIVFADPHTADDLAYLVDRSRAATIGDNRVVTVSLSAPSEDVRVSYVVSAPVWRVSYRVMCDGDAISLVAVGIVRNPVDEDLTDVALTLTTGRPTSFDIDLYNDRFVSRATLDEVRDSVEPPVVYAPAMAADETMMFAAPAPPMPGAAPKARATRAMASSMGPALAETGDSGEYFEYRVGVPVSLKRGMAAMVPLISTELAGARRERIWRMGAEPAPDLVVAFENSSGAVLEAGPAVIYDGDVDRGESYAGEAMVPFTPRGGKVLLPFGKDLAIACDSDSSTSTVATRVRFADSALIEEVRIETVHTLRVANRGDKTGGNAGGAEVIVEVYREPGSVLLTGDDLVAPFEETATHRRFRISAPAQSTATVRTGSAVVTSRYVGFANLTGHDLDGWLATRILDDEAFAELSEVLSLRDKAADLDVRAEELQAVHAEALAEQSRLTEQLGVLRDSGPEAAVRASTVAKLVAAQERVTQLEAEQRALRTQAAQARQASDAALAALIARRA